MHVLCLNKTFLTRVAQSRSDQSIRLLILQQVNRPRRDSGQHAQKLSYQFRCFWSGDERRAEKKRADDRAGRNFARGRGGRGGYEQRGRGSFDGREIRDRDGGRGRGRGRYNGDSVSDIRQEGRINPSEKEEPVQTLGIAVAKKGRTSAGYCYGCGADLLPKTDNTTNNNTTNSATVPPATAGGMHVTTKKGGYWNEKRELVRISKLKNWALCDRCKKLTSKKQVNDDVLLALAPNSHMTEVFRREVSKIRQRENAVVVLCLDASNWSGSYIKTMRNYVGGNPILLAVTRCDLLPSYMSASQTQQQLADFYKTYTKGIQPAAVYLCSSTDGATAPSESDSDDSDNDEYDEDYDDLIPPSYKNRQSDRNRRRRDNKRNNAFGGMDDLANDLHKYLEDRDPYIVGAANIGKSTLTDALITEILDRGQDEFEQGRRERRQRMRRRTNRRGKGNNDRFETKDSRLTKKRISKILESRVTKSSLPGTTLQNIRIPCFVNNHEQALWDTPGLLLDESLKHFPIRDFPRVRALRPEKIAPVEMIVEASDMRSFALVIYERDDEEELPLLRVNVLRKKNAGGQDESIKLIWNSTLSRSVLATKIISIDEAERDERLLQDRVKELLQQRKEEQQQQQQQQQEEQKDKDKDQQPQRPMTKDERAQRKEDRRRAWQERVKQEKKELGDEEWHRRQKILDEEQYQLRRLKTLSNHEMVHDHINEANIGTDISIANMGWLGVLTPGTTMLQVFASNTGVRVDHNPTIGLPPSWGDYERAQVVDDPKPKSEDDYEDEEWNDDEDWAYAENFGEDYDEDDYSWPGDTVNKGSIANTKSYDDPWQQYRGKHVGWEFDDKTRFSTSRQTDGWYPIRKKQSSSYSDK